jgi:acyl dehydratase
MTDTPPVHSGQTRAALTFGPVTRTDIVRYAGASGDFNPIHHDEAAATKAGFPSVISIGMYQAGLLASYATDWLGPQNIRKFSVRFKEQVWPGDELTCRGAVSAVKAHVDGFTVVVELTCTRHTGGVALEGTAEFLLARCDRSAAPT